MFCGHCMDEPCSCKHNIISISPQATNFNVVENAVGAFCMKCGYLYPDKDDPCEGCKVREMMDNLSL